MAIKKDDINILDLPVVENVAPGDYMILETPDGTSIIDYENFIIGPENTTLSVEVSSIANTVAVMSADVLNTIDSLSTEIYENFKQLYIGTATVVLDSGNVASSYLDPIPPRELEYLDPNDFIIIPANEAACLYPCYIREVVSTDAGWGTFSVYTPIKRNNFSINGDVNARIIKDKGSLEIGRLYPEYSISGSVTAFRLSELESIIEDYISNCFVTTTESVTQNNQQTVSYDETAGTAIDLADMPTYIIKYIKTY
jgi:hypothetical protein